MRGTPIGLVVFAVTATFVGGSLIWLTLHQRSAPQRDDSALAPVARLVSSPASLDLPPEPNIADARPAQAAPASDDSEQAAQPALPDNPWLEMNLLVQGRVLNEDGNPIMGANVRWRQVTQGEALPPYWDRHHAQGAADAGWNVAYTTQNPLSNGLSVPVRLGRGFRAFDTGIAHRIATVPGRRYRAAIDARYVLAINEEVGVNADHSDAMWWSDFDANFGVDPTGQAGNHHAPTIQCVRLRPGPANVWRRLSLSWVAQADHATLWLRASTMYSAVSLAWFDNLHIEDLSTGSQHQALAALDISNVVDGNAVTDAEGRFWVALDRPAACLFEAKANGFQWERVERDFRQNADPFDITLRLGSEIAGHVRDATTAAPIPGCEVTVILADQAHEDLSSIVIDKTLTDADGHFSFTSLPGGEKYGLLLERWGYASGYLPQVDLGDTRIVAELSPKQIITANVWWADTKEPVMDATVQVRDEDGRNLAAGACHEGNTAHLVVPGPGRYGLTPSRDDALDAQEKIAWVEVEDGVETPTVDLFLTSGGSLDLLLLSTKDDQPVPDVLLELTMLEQGRGQFAIRHMHQRFAMPITNAHGRALRSGFAPGRYILGVHGAQHRFDADWLQQNGLPAQGTIPLTIHQGETTAMTIKIETPFLLRGVVVDSSGAPVVAKVIPFSPESGENPWQTGRPIWTDDEGRFQLALSTAIMPPWTVGASAEGVGVGKVSVRHPRELAEEVVIELTPWCRVTGTLHTEAGDAVAGAIVNLFLGRHDGPEYAGARTNSRGAFTIDSLPPEVYQMMVEPEPGFRLHSAELVLLNHGASEAKLALVIPAWSEVTLLWEQDDGTPMAHAVMGIFPRLGDHGATTWSHDAFGLTHTTDQDGLVLFPAFLVGNYSTFIEAPNHGFEQFTVRAGEENIFVFSPGTPASADLPYVPTVYDPTNGVRVGPGLIQIDP